MPRTHPSTTAGPISTTFFDQAGLQQELEELPGRTVDVVVESGISPDLQERILSEAVPR